MLHCIYDKLRLQAFILTCTVLYAIRSCTIDTTCQVISYLILTSSPVPLKSAFLRDQHFELLHSLSAIDAQLTSSSIALKLWILIVWLYSQTCLFRLMTMSHHCHCVLNSCQHLVMRSTVCVVLQHFQTLVCQLYLAFKPEPAGSWATLHRHQMNHLL